MLATDANGLPLGMLTMSAGIGEVRMAERSLATIQVPQKKGKPKSRPRQLIADKGYDSRTLRRSLYRRGIRPCNWKPHQGRTVKEYTEEHRRRWPVEPGALWADSHGSGTSAGSSSAMSAEQRTSMPST
jgi:hypothetical protein